MTETAAAFGETTQSGRPTVRVLLARLTPAAFVEALEAEQERWFLWLPVFFGAGIAAYFQLPSEPQLLLAVAPVPIALVLSLLWRRGSLAVIVTGALLASAMGFALAKIRTDLVAAPVLERQYGFADVRGFVELVEPRPSRGQRITLRLTSFAGLAHEKMPYRIRVRTMSAIAGLKPGDGLRLKATLGPPGIPALPGDYDFARAAWFMKLGGIGYTFAKPMLDPDLGAPPQWLQFWASVERVRLAIGLRIGAALSGESGQIAMGLITGERGGITQATTPQLIAAGADSVAVITALFGAPDVAQAAREFCALFGDQ